MTTLTSLSLAGSLVVGAATMDAAAAPAFELPGERRLSTEDGLSCRVSHDHPAIPGQEQPSGMEWCGKRGNWLRCVDGKKERLRTNVCDPNYPEVPHAFGKEFILGGCGEVLCPGEIDVDSLDFDDWFEGPFGAYIAKLPGLGDPFTDDESVFVMKLEPGFEGKYFFHSARTHGVVLSGLSDWIWRGDDLADRVADQPWLAEGHTFMVEARDIQRHIQVVSDEPLVILLWVNGKLDYNEVKECAITLFDKGGFLGETMEFDGVQDIPDLEEFDDKTGSIHIQGDECFVTVFGRTEFQGRTATLGAGWHKASDLKDLGNLQWRISSMKIYTKELGYTIGASQPNSCPPGFQPVTSVSECQAAAKAMGRKWLRSDGTPGVCTYITSGTPWEDNRHSMYFGIANASPEHVLDHHLLVCEGADAGQVTGSDLPVDASDAEGARLAELMKEKMEREGLDVVSEVESLAGVWAEEFEKEVLASTSMELLFEKEGFAGERRRAGGIKEWAKQFFIDLILSWLGIKTGNNSGRRRMSALAAKAIKSAIMFLIKKMIKYLVSSG